MSVSATAIGIVLSLFAASLFVGALVFLCKSQNLATLTDGASVPKRHDRKKKGPTGKYDYGGRDNCCNSRERMKDLMELYAVIFYVLAAVGAIIVMVWGGVESVQHWHHANCSNWARGSLQVWFFLFALPLSEAVDILVLGDEEDKKKKYGLNGLVLILLVYGIVLGIMGFCDEVKDETHLYELYAAGMSSIALASIATMFFIFSITY